MSVPNQINCPYCGQGYAVGPGQWPDYEGRTIACTKCSRPFTVSARLQHAAPAPPPPPPPPQFAARIAPPPFPVVYPPSAPARRGLGAGAIVAIVLGCLFVLTLPLLLAVLLPALNQARAAAQQVKCAAHLKNIGLACMIYANNSPNGEYPDSWQSLIQSTNIDLPTFVCPASDDTPASGKGSQQIAADLFQGGHYSYIYAGKGLHAGASSNEVLAYEPLNNHRDAGINVLYVDGRVVWFRTSQAQELIFRLQNRPERSASFGHRQH